MGGVVSVSANLGHAPCAGENGVQQISLATDASGLFDLNLFFTAIVAQQETATFTLTIKNSLFQTVYSETRNLTTTSNASIFTDISYFFPTALPAGTYEATLNLKSDATTGEPPVPIDYSISTTFIVQEPVLTVNCDNCSKSFGMCSTFGVLNYSIDLPPRTLTPETFDSALPKTIKIEIINACNVTTYTKTFSGVTSASGLVNNVASGTYKVRATATDTLGAVCVLEESCTINGPNSCCFASRKCACRSK